MMQRLIALCLLLLLSVSPASAYWQSRDSNSNATIPSAGAFYTASGPSSGVAGAASTNFTVTLASGTFSGAQTITIADGSSSGVFTPNVGSPGTSTVTVTPIAGTNNFSFTYKARQNGVFTLTFTNAQGWTPDPSPLSYTASESFNVSGPISGPVSSPSTNFTVTLAGGATFTGAQTVTIADGSSGGTITPSVGSPGTSTVTVTPTVGLTNFTFTYTPASVTTITLAFTNAQGWLPTTQTLNYISNSSPLTQIMDPAGAPANSNAPTVLTTTATVPIGSLMLFAAYPSTLGATLSTVTDQGTGGSNSYTIVPLAGTGGVTTGSLAYVASTTHTIPSGTTFTVQTSDGSQYNPRGAWYSTAYSGGRDTSGSVITASTATTVAGLATGTLANAADLVFGYVAPFSATSASIVSPSSPWALVYNNGHTHFDYALPAATTTLAYAPTWTTASNYSAVLLSFKPTYVGPGDVTGNWLVWHGLRAFSAATRGAALVNVCNSTGGVDVGCADLSSDPATGNLVAATVSGITCPGANCTVKSWYDQTGGGRTVTQATVSARATLGASCIGTLPCATGVDIVNGIYTAASPLVTSVPWSMTSVVFWVSGSDATVEAGTLQAQTAANERLNFVQTTNLAGFSCGAGTTATQSVTPNNWFAQTGVCNGGATSIFAVNATTNTGQSAGGDALVSSGSTYSIMRKSVGKFVEGGTNSAGFSAGTITSLHSNERTYWGF